MADHEPLSLKLHELLSGIGNSLKAQPINQVESARCPPVVLMLLIHSEHEEQRI
ncbi:MAG TPA: hypothetical protein VIG99_00185 [Myxococcaceae bacterium]|jgi:hypothetical protein